MRLPGYYQHNPLAARAPRTVEALVAIVTVSIASAVGDKATVITIASGTNATSAATTSREASRIGMTADEQKQRCSAKNQSCAM